MPTNAKLNRASHLEIMDYKIREKNRDNQQIGELASAVPGHHLSSYQAAGKVELCSKKLLVYRGLKLEMQSILNYC